MKTQYKKALIICDEFADLPIYKKDTLYVGVEKGCLNLIKNNIFIDIAISDFDSVTFEELKLISKNTKKIIKLPINKDFVDGEFAVKKIKSLLIDNIELYLPINNRIDMSFCSYYFANKYNIKIFVKHNLIEPFFSNKIKKINYNEYKEYKYISIIAITKSQIKIHNLKYGSNEIINLEPFSSRGISNELIFKKNSVIELLIGKSVLFFIK